MKGYKKILSAILALALTFSGMAVPTEVQAAETNLALNCDTTASNQEDEQRVPSNATDGNVDTRWGTAQNRAEGEWIQVDLGSLAEINKIIIRFERADAEQNILGYHVAVDGLTKYTFAATDEKQRASQVETITFDQPVTGRVVKLEIDAADGGTANWKSASVRELEVYGTDAKENATEINLEVGESVAFDGIITSEVDGQEVVEVVKTVTAPYNKVDEIVSGKSYLIGRNGDANGNVSALSEFTRTSNSTAHGLEMYSTNINNENDAYSHLLWTITGDNDNGYTIKNNTSSRYMFFENANCSGNNRSVKLGQGQELEGKSVEMKINAIDNQFNFQSVLEVNANDGHAYLHYAGGPGYVLGWPEGSITDSKWDLYTGEEKVTLTGKSIGSTMMKIGEAVYVVNVTGDIEEVNVTVDVNDSVSLINDDSVYTSYKMADGGESTVDVVLGFNQEQILSASELKSGKEYLLIPNRGSSESPAILTSLANGEQLKLISTSYAPRWKIEESKTDTGKYNISREGHYLTISANTAGVKDTPVNLDINFRDDGTTDGGENNVGWIIGENGQLLNRWGGQTGMSVGGYNTLTDVGSKWQIWKAGTAITFTGRQVGRTTVTVGNVRYNIVVRNPLAQKPEDGETTGQPFPTNTAGSGNFRIPCMVTLNDGTIVTACDARWTTYMDGGGLDTIVSYSKDNGATWNYTFANHLGDNGNVHNWASTAFIDPSLATDGQTVWMIADLFPAGVALNGANYSPQTGHTGYDDDGNLVLAEATASVHGDSTAASRKEANFQYYLEKIAGAEDNAESYYQLKDGDGNNVEGYKIDAFFNIKGENVDTNLFMGDSPYFPYPTDFLYMTKSEDGGETWSVPSLIDVKKTDEATVLVCPGRATVVYPDFKTKRIIFPVYEHTSGREYTSVIYSDDNGATWTRSNNMSANSSEAGITEADGRLYMFTRHGGYYVSEDYGETWSAKETDVPAYNTGTQLSAITYSEKIDGKTAILLSVPGSGASRTNGKIYVILVDEETGALEWKYDYDVTDAGVTFAYSCLSEVEGGNVGILYEYANTAITYESIAIEDIVGDVEVGAMWLTDTNGNVVKSLKMGSEETVTLNVNGAESARVTVESDNEAITASYENNVVTLRTAENVEGLILATVTVTSGEEVSTVKVEITGTEQYEIVNLRMGDEKVITDDSGNYAATTDLTGVDANIADVSVTDLSNAELDNTQTYVQLINKDYTAFEGEELKIPVSDCLYTYNIEWNAKASNDVYLDPQGAASAAGYPNSSSAVALKISSGTLDNSFRIYGNSRYLYFKDTNFDRVDTTSGFEDYLNFFLYRKAVDGDDGSTELPGYVKASTVENDTAYLIVAKSGENYYALYPHVKSDNNKGTQVAQLIVEGETVTAKRLSDNTTDGVIEQCMYTFTVKPKLSAEAADGTTVYLTTANDKPTMPNRTGDKVSSVNIVKQDHGFEFQFAEGSMHFHHEKHSVSEESMGMPYINKCSSYHSEADSYKHDFEVYRPIADGETSSEEFLGYIKVTDEAEFVDGGQYLITHKNVDNDIFVLHPSTVVAEKNALESYAHVAMVTTPPVPLETTITIKGVSEGETSVKVGDMTYYIIVENDEKEVTLKVGDEFTVLGKLQGQATDAADYIELTEKVAFAPYEKVDRKDNDQGVPYAEEGEYLIGWKDTSKILTNNGNDGGTMLALKDAALTTDDCSENLWKITSVDGGYHIQDVNGKYLTIDSNNVSIKDDPAVLTFETGGDDSNGYAVKGNGVYLNHYQGSSNWVSTYSNDTGWNLYRATNNGCIIKANVIGETSVTIDGVDYTIKVVPNRNEDFVAKDVVVDFGLPVTVNYEAIGATLVKGSAAYGKVDITGDSAAGNWSVTYTPTSVLQKADTVTLTDGGNEYTFKVYPATNVYYEEGFAKYTGDGWSLEPKSATPQQSAVIGSEEAYNYGYDGAYNSMTQTVAQSTVIGDRMEFEFTGTGVDVYANCANDTGMVMIQVKVTNDKGNLEKMDLINTELNVDNTVDEGLGNIGTAKNVPIVSIAPGTLKHGKHYVKINHVKKNTAEDTKNGILIDGFRVYDTIDAERNEEAAAIYASDGEANAIYTGMRDQVIASLKSDAQTAEEAAAEAITAQAEETGALILSGISSGYTAEKRDAFIKNSSKNELYLYPQQSIVFNVEGRDALQIGLRALNGSVENNVTGDTALTANVDMFYTIHGTQTEADSNIYRYEIKNNAAQLTEEQMQNEEASAILAITKLKATDDVTQPTETAITFASLRSADLVPALCNLGYDSETSEEGTGDTDKQEPSTDIETPGDGETDAPVQETVALSRISGSNRYETAYRVADAYKTALGAETFDAVIVATGKNFADALSGSYLAAVKNAPILLTNGKADNVAELIAYIKANVTPGGTVYILGGTKAVPEAVEAVEAEGYKVNRLFGDTRYDTNIAILKEAGRTGNELIIATGKNFADSLSASALKKPILLVKDEITDAQRAVLRQYDGGKIYIIGGTNAVSEEIQTALAGHGRVYRISGETRYETSVAVADTFFKDAAAAVVASAKSFPDGLCGGPLAAAMNAPLILTADGKADAAAAYMQAEGIQSGIVLGGTARISEESVRDVFGLADNDKIIVK